MSLRWIRRVMGNLACRSGTTVDKKNVVHPTCRPRYRWYVPHNTVTPDAGTQAFCAHKTKSPRLAPEALCCLPLYYLSS